jgi:hypothetical protein
MFSMRTVYDLPEEKHVELRVERRTITRGFCAGPHRPTNEDDAIALEFLVSQGWATKTEAPPNPVRLRRPTKE